MDKKKAASFLIVLALGAVVVTTFVMLPKQHTVGQRMSQTVVFWNDHDAFLLLSLNSIGRSRNILQGKLSGTRYGYLTILAGGYADFSKQDTVAFHLSSSGKLDRFTLPENTATYGAWGFADGQLQLTPPASSAREWVGTRWDGAKFVPVPAAVKAQGETQPQVGSNSNLSADDLVEDEDSSDEDSFLSKVSRQAFKEAGWHHKFLTGYESKGAAATLPLVLGESSFNLTIESSPMTKDSVAHFDLLSFGTRNIQLSGDKLIPGPQTLWTQNGWQPVSKIEYERLRAQYGNGRLQPSVASYVWLVVAVLLLFWRFGGWISLLFNFATVKGRVLKNMPTQFSFPPATPAQFPLLDLEALDRHTREFEGMGFARLIDFSLVSDSAANPPIFCRLVAHTRHHCFAEVSQIFPKGKAPFPLKGSIMSCLQNGWSISFSARKPQAASSLVLRSKAIGVCMPDSSLPELLHAFLKMRDQVCLDLGIQTVNDDTLEAYIARMQRSAAEMREAVQAKSFVKGIPEVYLRKFSLLKTKPEYIWLGDYPKEAEQRKQGFNTFAASAR